MRRRSRSSGGSSSSLTLSECLKLTVSGLLTGIIVMQVMDLVWGSSNTVEVSLSSPTTLTHHVSPSSSGSGNAGEEGGDLLGGSDEPQSRSPTKFPTAQPTPECLGSMGGFGSLSSSKGLFEGEQKVFVLEKSNSLSTTHLIKCLLNVVQAPENKIEPLVKVEDLVHLNRLAKSKNSNFLLTDLLILDAIKRHPMRVYDRSQADIIVPDVLPFLSFEMPDSDVLQSVCPDLPPGMLTHSSRMDLVADALAKDVDWAKPKLRNKFVFIHSKPLGQGGTMPSFPSELGDEIVRGKAVVLTSSDRFLKRWFKNHSTKKSIRAGNTLTSFSERVQIIPLMPNVEIHAGGAATKDIGLYFDDLLASKGDIKRLSGLFLNLTFVHARLNRLGVVDEQWIHGKRFERSKSCFIMEFDEQGKAQGLQTLYDSIQAECIPVFLAEEGLRLPVASGLNWDRAGFVVKGLKCISGNIVELMALKSQLDDPAILAEKRAIVSHLRESFAFPVDLMDFRHPVFSASNKTEEESQEQKSASGGLRLLQDEDDAVYGGGTAEQGDGDQDSPSQPDNLQPVMHMGGQNVPEKVVHIPGSLQRTSKLVDTILAVASTLAKNVA